MSEPHTINERALRYDEARAVARRTVGICPALVLESERRPDGFLGYHVCGNMTHPECKPFCGVHRVCYRNRRAVEEWEAP